MWATIAPKITVFTLQLVDEQYLKAADRWDNSSADWIRIKMGGDKWRSTVPTSDRWFDYDSRVDGGLGNKDVSLCDKKGRQSFNTFSSSFSFAGEPAFPNAAMHNRLPEFERSRQHAAVKKEREK
ncbi:hypothetical protein CCM_02895 [Cordyceps militaris CM01]|uniref:Uncharacterized protein n=1 Tax=Cordyceps militaris (strain CM01) TaxID=983644 RepID=G3JCG3_CORMM|nr:uncharacterized protein CCM_02895 [Cordyceps militaris CM01]EGX94624.1 hypothetical protein CCM_02895 [Cordyceps militaris CM01]